MTFDADKIVDIKIGAHSETPGISDPAFNTIPAQIIEKQSLAIDVVTGATFTSNGILEAVEAAVLLAAKTFMPVDAFVATVARYNELKGQDDVDFGKAAAAMTGLGEGPYVAIVVTPATIGTMGGIKVDLEMHVLDVNGNAIPGLYAAGACANGDFFYQEYPASGTSIMMCFTCGRIAGTNAAECD